MNEAKGGNYVRGSGSLAEGHGEIAWRLGDREGAVVLSKGEVTVAAEQSGEGGAPSTGWTFESSWDGDPLEGAAVFRHVALEAPDGATIVVSSTGPPGIEGHGLELTEGILRTNDDSTPFEETLLSTQYDPRGRPTRVGVELWPGDDAPPRRIAASLLAGAERGGTWAGFLRCRADGVEGLGSYLLWRA
jgi:hypothetical protein